MKWWIVLPAFARCFAGHSRKSCGIVWQQNNYSNSWVQKEQSISSWLWERKKKRQKELNNGERAGGFFSAKDGGDVFGISRVNTYHDSKQDSVSLKHVSSGPCVLYWWGQTRILSVVLTLQTQCRQQRRCIKAVSIQKYTNSLIKKMSMPIYCVKSIYLNIHTHNLIHLT